jgi:hypothetical protein
MRYTIQKLDGRFTFRKYFEYYIGFTGRMSNRQGPLYFNQAQEWFTQTYGWSAEARQYEDMIQWNQKSQMYFQGIPRIIRNSDRPEDLPACCNPYWSWTNGYDDLRIYVATEKELAFFQLSNPVDQ